jgi:hypothetical protein
LAGRVSLEHLLGAPLLKDSSLDFAIFASEQQNQVEFVDLFSLREPPQQKLARPHPAALLGFPHGVPLALSDACSWKSDIEEHYLRHDCDSLTGSSGGLLWDAESGKPLGLNQKGDLLASGSSTHVNRALRLTPIVEQILLQASEVAKEIWKSSRARLL